MKRKLIFIVASLLVALWAVQANAQFGSTSKDAPAIAQRNLDQTVQTMLLGVYHFNNPGMDELNMEVDDYFADKRQEEIAAVVASIAKFKPTKIFVEAKPEYQEVLDERYQAFVKGELDLEDLKNGRSETYQLGFRIAKACELSGVECVDASGAWLGSDVNKTAEQLMPEFNSSVRDEMNRMNDEENKRMISRTIGENLIEMNSRESIMLNHSYYNQLSTLVVDPGKPTGLEFDTKEIDGEEFMMIGVEKQNIGAELVGKWYTRNIKIFSNIIRAVEKDDERVLVIFGQGHIRPIQHFCEDHPILQLVDPVDYLAGGK
ncbi:DUF5694 domain-containing protein [bacterium]|nr:DUF5694 domain-containing protein [bacterium]